MHNIDSISQQGVNTMIEYKDKSVIKWKSSLRKHMINVLALLENHEQPQMEIKHQLIKANVCFNNWHSDVAEWEKHTFEYELPQIEERIGGNYCLHFLKKKTNGNIMR